LNVKNRKTLKFEYLNILENLEVALFKTLTKKLKIILKQN